MDPVSALLLGLRVLLETGIVAGLAYWGYSTGDTTATRAILTIGAPLVGFGIWGVIDFRQAGRLAEPLRLVEELAISGLAAAGLIVTGQAVLGWTLAALSIGYHALVYLTGNLLLGRPAQTPRARHEPTRTVQDWKEAPWIAKRHATER